MNEENKNNDKNTLNENAKVEKKEIDLLDFITLFWKERKKIIYITVIFTIIGLIYALLSDPWYKATVKLLPTESGSNRLLNQYSSLAALAGINLGGESGDKYALYPEIIKSNFILNRILKNHFKTRTFQKPVTLFEFWETEIDSSKKNWRHKLFEEAKNKLRENCINVTIDKRNNLLTMDVIMPRDPVLAADLANFIVDQLEIYNKHYRHYKASDQRKFIEQSIKDTKINLEKTENDLKYFLEKNKDIASPENRLKYEKLKTELDLYKNVYIELKKQIELAKIQEIRETETLNVLEKAVIPIDKIKPKRLIIVVSMILLGILFSLTYVLLNWFFRNLIFAIKNNK